MAEISLPISHTHSHPEPHPEPHGHNHGGSCSAEGSHVQAADAPGAGPKVYLETFGCQMNELDSQLVTSQLRGLGYRFTNDWKTADVILYNTCSVREQAENKALSRVGIVGMMKNDRPEIVLGVMGCMAERDGADMIRRHPQIDVLCGPGELDKMPMLIDNIRKTKIQDRSFARRAGGDKAFAQSAQIALQGNTTRRSATLSAAEDTLEALDLARSFTPSEQGAVGEDGAVLGNPRTAYVRITRGCNKFCTYCVVPNTRGAEVHRHPDAIVEECRKLAAAGVIEITLLGQTVNHYHYDLAQAVRGEAGHWQPQVGTVISPNKGTGGPSPVFSPTTVSFAQLLRRIHDEVPGVLRLRFVTNYPRDFGNDILETIRDCPRICRYLHLPVQSGSDRVLAKMNRGYRVAQYMDLIARVREYLPDVELATDIIVGYPGETEEDFQATAALMRHCRYKNSYIFKYSPRPGTAAYDSTVDDISDEVKRRRNQDLLTLQNEIGIAVNQAYLGKTVEVLVEGVSRRGERAANAADTKVTLGWAKPVEVTQLSGRTGGDIIVFFEGDPALVGKIVKVKIGKAVPLAIFGERVE